MPRTLHTLAGAGLLLASGLAYATAFNFSGTANGGIGSAEMDITISGKTLTAIIDNTSPINLIDGTVGGNSPGITGFGFNLNPDTLSLLSWTLTARAFNKNTNSFSTLTIGSSASGAYDWSMGSSLAGVSLDYLPTTGGQIDGALFNPLAATNNTNNTLPGGQNDVYFTTATLTMNFNSTPTLVVNQEYFSPFVRLQRVGSGGEGSLKLIGEEEGGGGGQTVPLPSTLLLLGAGLLGMRRAIRRIPN